MSQADAIDLLGIARETLISTLLPVLPNELHYEARMIANAIAIASREIESAGMQYAQERELLELLLATDHVPDQPSALLDLSHRIRRGELSSSSEAQEKLITALTQLVVCKLKVSNPKLLKDA